MVGAEYITNKRKLNPLAELKERGTMYPFCIRHLGRKDYILYALAAQDRDIWLDKIVEAKARRIAYLLEQNDEPISLRLIADSSFAYPADSVRQGSVTIPGAPLDRAVKDLELIYGNNTPQPVISRSRVNCAVAFTSPHDTKQIAVVGTDDGVYGGWLKVLSFRRISLQILIF